MVIMKIFFNFLNIFDDNNLSIRKFFLCNSFGDSRVSVKFDNGPVQSMGCTDSSDGSNNVAFFTNQTRMLAGLKKAKRTVVEAEFFQMGRQQFVFETAGLEWK